MDIIFFATSLQLNTN